MTSSQIFLKIKFVSGPPLIGEAEYSGFQGQIELLDFDWSLEVTGDAGFQRGGERKRKPSFGTFKMTKKFDSSSIPLYNRMKSREKIEWAVVTVAHSLGNDLESGLRRAMEYKISDARLTNVTVGMSGFGKGLIVQENLEFTYAKIEVVRFKISEDGRYGRSRETALTYTSRATGKVGLA